MRLYIAGPMTGLPDYNYPAFDAAAADLTERGHEAINPARRGLIGGWSWADYLRAALRDVTDAEGIATLPGWRASRGACLEVHVATTLGMPVRGVHEWQAVTP